MVYVEKDCTFEHEGRKFESGGAVVTPDSATGYPKFDREYVGATGIMCDWHGNTLGTAKIVSRWATPRSVYSSHMYQIESTIDGVKYTGRGNGSGMVWNGKRKAGK